MLALGDLEHIGQVFEESLQIRPAKGYKQMIFFRPVSPGASGLHELLKGEYIYQLFENHFQTPLMAMMAFHLSYLEQRQNIWAMRCIIRCLKLQQTPPVIVVGTT